MDIKDASATSSSPLLFCLNKLPMRISKKLFFLGTTLITTIKNFKFFFLIKPLIHKCHSIFEVTPNL
jgi:hypothetical protein